MNSALLSYIIGGTYGLFLCVQYLVFYLVLAFREEKNQLKQDLAYISVIAVSILLFSVFGSLSGLALPYLWESVFLHIRFVVALMGLNAFVMLLRYHLIMIKDMTFVETDEYKDNTKSYLRGFNLLSLGLGILVLLAAVFNSSHLNADRAVSIFGFVFLIGVLILEPLEFIKIFHKERGKLNHFSRLRLLTVLWSGELAYFSLAIEILLDLIGVSVKPSIFMYGSIILSVGLSANLIFEHMELLSTVNDSNQKLNELNQSIMEDVRMAQSLQISLLPIEKQRDIRKLLDIEISYMPMQSVGGDYYDYYQIGEKKVLILLGDASGHGVYAAMIWAMLKVEVEELIEENLFGDLDSAFNLLNKRITRLLENTYSYATLFSCIVDIEHHTVSYITAGHTDQLFFNARERTVNCLRNKNPIVGTFPNAVFHADTLTGKTGDVLMLFTDGIVEAQNPLKEQLQTDRLADILEKACLKDSSQAGVVLGNVLTEVEEFTEGAVQQDDRTLIMIRL